jgi:hypothetical protein
VTNAAQKYADTHYSSAVGLLVVSLVFGPAILVPSRPRLSVVAQPTR